MHDEVLINAIRFTNNEGKVEISYVLKDNLFSLIITDSGGIQEEGPSLRKPILVFRKVTERPEGLTTGGVKLIGLERESVVREASRLLDDQEAYQKTTANGNPYGDGRAAERIIQAIQYHFGRAERPEDFVYHPASSAQG